MLAAAAKKQRTAQEKLRALEDPLPLGFEPTQAKFFDKLCGKKKEDVHYWGVARNFTLDERELELFRRNGFVVSQRLGGANFAKFYYDVYNNDLPVFITADSVLHAFHSSFEDVTAMLEETVILPTLSSFLASLMKLAASVDVEALSDPVRESLSAVRLFLHVAASLASQHTNDKTNRAGAAAAEAVASAALPDEADGAAVEAAAQQVVAGRGVVKVPVLGHEQEIDLGTFHPRGHYQRTEQLKDYFRAMSWLGVQVPCEEWEAWQRMEDLLRNLVGQPEAAGLPAMAEALAQAGVHLTNAAGGNKGKGKWSLREAAAAVGADATAALGAIKAVTCAILTANWGAQRYSGGPGEAGAEGTAEEDTDQPPWAMSRGLFPALKDEGGRRVNRRMASALDVAFSALGNDAALSELQRREALPPADRTEDTAFRDSLPCVNALGAARRVIDSLPDEAWHESVYHQWISVLRTLSRPLNGEGLPSAMQTREWAMKDLNTQLASWTQLRHDTILYVQQTYILRGGCSYPLGAVEQRPEFWVALAGLADSLSSVLRAQRVPRELPGRSKYSREPGQRGAWVVVSAADMMTSAAQFLGGFARRCEQLGGIAAKQRARQPLSGAESKMLQTVVESIPGGSGSSTYSGWYCDMFYGGIYKCGESPALISDIMTDGADPASGDRGAVLYNAVGGVDALVAALDMGPGLDGADAAVYVGPTAAHYEACVRGVGKRLDDTQWKCLVAYARPQRPLPERPSWTRGYLVGQREKGPVVTEARNAMEVLGSAAELHGV